MYPGKEVTAIYTLTQLLEDQHREPPAHVEQQRPAGRLLALARTTRTERRRRRAARQARRLRAAPSAEET